MIYSHKIKPFRCLVLLCICLFFLFLLYRAYPKLEIAYHYNQSSLHFLSGNINKASEYILNRESINHFFPAVYYYHHFLLSSDSTNLAQAFHKNPSSFFYLMAYTDQFMNEREWIKARPYFYSIRWAQYLTRKGMELANKSEEDSAYRGLFYLLFAKKISQDTRISHDLGSVLAFRHQAYEKGELLLMEALSKDVRNPQIYRTLGRLYVKRNQKALALSCYESARRLDPNLYSNYIDLARIYRDAKSYSQALSWYQSAQKLDPLQETAYYEKARIYTSQNQSSKAMAEYREIVFLLPDKHNPRYQWGVYLFQQKEWEPALTQLTISIALKPDHLWSYYYRALVLLEQNQTQKALNDITKALELNPQQSSVVNLFNRIKKSLNTK
jgi:tetratricopeptide (TPR) repeat protein